MRGKLAPPDFLRFSALLYVCVGRCKVDSFRVSAVQIASGPRVSFTTPGGFLSLYLRSFFLSKSAPISRGPFQDPQAFYSSYPQLFSFYSFYRANSRRRDLSSVLVCDPSPFDPPPPNTISPFVSSIQGNIKTVISVFFTLPRVFLIYFLFVYDIC